LILTKRIHHATFCIISCYRHHHQPTCCPSFTRGVEQWTCHHSWCHPHPWRFHVVAGDSTRRSCSCQLVRPLLWWWYQVCQVYRKTSQYYSTLVLFSCNCIELYFWWVSEGYHNQASRRLEPHQEGPMSLWAHEGIVSIKFIQVFIQVLSQQSARLLDWVWNCSFKVGVFGRIPFCEEAIISWLNWGHPFQFFEQSFPWLPIWKWRGRGKGKGSYIPGNCCPFICPWSSWFPINSTSNKIQEQCSPCQPWACHSYQSQSGEEEVSVKG